MRLSNADILRLIPGFMKNDDAIMALAKAVNKLIAEPGSRVKQLRIWDQIDELDHADLDELAWELNVDWYSSVLELGHKRETIKISDQVHAKRGTKRAVEQLISAYFGPGYVREWFEYDGVPFTFEVLTTNRHITDANFKEFSRIAKEAKSARSRLAGICYSGVFQAEIIANSDIYSQAFDFIRCGTRYRSGTLGSILRGGSLIASSGLSSSTFEFTTSGQIKAGSKPRIATIGALLNYGIEVVYELSGKTIDFTKAGLIKSGTAPRVAIVGSTAEIAEAVVAAEFEGHLFALTKAGTKHRAGTIGEIVQYTAEATYSLIGVPFALSKAGIRKASGSTVGKTLEAMVAIVSGAIETVESFHFTACGTNSKGYVVGSSGSVVNIRPEFVFQTFEYIKCGTQKCS